AGVPTFTGVQRDKHARSHAASHGDAVREREVDVSAPRQHRSIPEVVRHALGHTQVEVLLEPPGDMPAAVRSRLAHSRLSTVPWIDDADVHAHATSTPLANIWCAAAVAIHPRAWVSRRARRRDPMLGR